MRVSVLDQSPIKSGVLPATSIRETLDLAKQCEALGYHRYWLSEHHNSPALAGSAPEVLMAAIAATTSRIRVGSAGIMLPHYSAYKVAEQFRTLEAIAPGRIDLGLGRAPGSDGRTALALNPNVTRGADNFPAQVRDVWAWTSGAALPAEHPFRDLAANPVGDTAPALWILGSSNYGAELAAWFGLPYCFAWFFSDGEGGAEAIASYRKHFRPSALCPEPHCAIVVWALAAPSFEEAEYWYRSRGFYSLMRSRGHFVPLPTPEEVAATSLTPADLDRLAEFRKRSFVGTGPDVAARLTRLAQSLGLNELVITTGTTNHEARVNSYRLLSEAFGLPAQAA
jgi:luciferase family oxidoreductase group 1